MWPYFNVPVEGHTRQDWLYNALVTNVTLFQSSHGRSYKTGLTVQCISNNIQHVTLFSTLSTIPLNRINYWHGGWDQNC
jgi:hypothetical protein